MDRNLVRSAATILLITLTGVSSHADEKVHQEAWDLKHSPATESEFRRREDLITRELRSGNMPEWAGEFAYGDGMGVNVRVVLAPKNGFVFTWHGCMGLYDINYGTVEVRNGRVFLDFALPNMEQGFEGLAGEFLPVRWGDRVYLLAERETREFANAINAGFEPGQGTSGRFLLRSGGEQKVPAGRPDLPAEYLGYLLDKPIDAVVLSVLENNARSDEKTGFNYRSKKVQIDVGKQAGVWEGMAFHDVAPKATGETFRVTRVDEFTSIAVSFEPFFDSIPDREGEKTASCLSTSIRGGCRMAIASAR